jgi:S-adenosylmethionine:tRNA ribosyltransferase-isomerase
MRAAHEPVQRPRDARLLTIDAMGRIGQRPRARFADLLRPGDLLIANDAATLPASLAGIHLPTAEPIELRLAGRSSLRSGDIRRFSAVVFGKGDWRTRTEDRAPPPLLAAGDRLALGPLTARIEAILGHPRFVRLAFDGVPDAIWAGLARHGRPIQYAHLARPLAPWDTWTSFANLPAAFEPPSAGFALDWRLLAELRARGVGFAALTHAAGISSTGDPALDARLPFDEPYDIPAATVAAVGQAKSRGGRVIAIGTTVVRALEHAAGHGALRAGEGVATNRLGPGTALRIVDAILSGTHEAGTSHFELLRAFAPNEVIEAADHALNAMGYRTHEFGDSVFLEKFRGRLTEAPGGLISQRAWHGVPGLPG